MADLTKYTTGKWEALGLTVSEASGEHRDIAEVFSCHEFTVSITEEEAEANARLISAVPELAKAALDFVAWVDDVWGSAALSEKALADYEAAKAALKKAGLQ